jgi:predicted acylesterase/phospholipase RssA
MAETDNSAPVTPGNTAPPPPGTAHPPSAVTMSSTPLERIALACSGGGYRATGFHLGGLSYLNQVTYRGKPLLENVKMISTVSGGSIAGVVYALKKQEGASFAAIFKFITDLLNTVDLLKSGLEKLNPGTHWNNPGKRKNLINAWSELYDQHFTGGATFAALNPITPQSHLEAVVFNSTEFSNAVDFRFRNNGTGVFGNYYLEIDPALALEVKLADALASSACFPAAFEPIMWPADFIHAGSPLLTAKKDQLPTAAIMDGGIYDNQGIESILMYEKITPDRPFDLIIISDVLSPSMPPFKPTADEPKTGFRSKTVGEVKRDVMRINNNIGWILGVLTLLFAALPLSWRYTNRTGTGICLTLAVALLGCWIGKAWLWKKLAALAAYAKNKILNPVPPFILQSLASLKLDDLSVRRVEPLLLDRLNSLLDLLLNVFLKIVRSLNYAKIYEVDAFRYRRISHLIYQLTAANFTTQTQPWQAPPEVRAKSTFTGNYASDVGSKIQTVAELATSYGITLWFTDLDKMNNTLNTLVATGRFTMCYNLIAYLESLLYDPASGFDALPPATQEELKKTYAQCLADWAGFKADPLTPGL